MMTIPYLTAIRISGADAGQFLHNQLSADVLGLSAGQTTFACYCEPKGRVLALMLVARQADDYLVVISSSLTTAIVNRMRMYVLRDQVTLEALDDCTILGHSDDPDTGGSSEYLARLAIPNSDDALLLVNSSTAADQDPALLNNWKIAELKRGIVWLCTETSGQFLPQMLGYDSLGAVNFKKGCYPGQEIVARTHYLGKIKRHPRLLCTTAIICPNPLDKIEIISGEVTHAAIVADCGHREDGGTCLFTVTRMDPETEAGQIEYQGQLAPLV